MPRKRKKREAIETIDDLPDAQIVFVGPNGEETDGPLITPPCEPPRHYDDEQWDKDQTVRELRYWLQCRNRTDSAGIEAIMRAMDRLGCWHKALEQLIIDSDKSLGVPLLRFWRECGFHIGRSLKGNLILVDALKHLLPPYGGIGLTLYRGELDARHRQSVYGISWTSDFSVARTFARRFSPDEGEGVVLKIDASPEMIVAASVEHPSHLREEDYIIDPRLIRSVSAIP